MNRNTLAEIFADTRSLCRTNAALSAACARSREVHSFYQASEKIGCVRERFESEVEVIVSRKRTFEAAEAHARAGMKVAALNFANSYEPGGGVVHGARAQEECLCRVSTLYDSLSSPEMMERFYLPHRKAGDDLATDDIIYTPSVIVFKSDTAEPHLRPEPEWFSADVITCAAPHLRHGSPAPNADALLKMHESRGRRILDAACKHGADAVVLGAFGCGAFSNPPEVVAAAYKNLLPDYRRAFRAIEFAVFCRDFETQNYDVFAAALGR